jgi:serine/threonine-protein kinase
MSLFDNPSTTTPTAIPAPDGSVSAFRPGTDTSALRALQTIVEPGTTIDHFQVGRLLGRGSVAAVYEGTDTAAGRPVAMKILDARFTSDAQMVARFLAEGEALAQFNHPNIVHHVAHGVDETFAYIAMEFVRGINLDQLIHSIEIEPRHIVHLAREISKGLTTLHAAGMLHGDVKPSNILVTRAGDVKISDFGTAARARALRTGNKVYGTAAYMAPELFNPTAEIDYRADIYSLGVTFYKILTGKIPADPFVPATILNPHLPAGVDAILARAMAIKADDRFTTAKEFCDTLASLFDENASTTPISAAAEPAGDHPENTTAPKHHAKAESHTGIDWKMVLLCGLAAIGLAATLIVLGVVFGYW